MLLDNGLMEKHFSLMNNPRIPIVYIRGIRSHKPEMLVNFTKPKPKPCHNEQMSLP